MLKVHIVILDKYMEDSSSIFLASIFLFHVLQFIVKDSVEEKMVAIQRKKQDLVEKAFGSTNSDRKTSRIDDIKALMEL